MVWLCETCVVFQMYRDIIADLDAAAANSAVRVAVLTGEGEYYSSGNDLKNVAVLGEPGGLELAYKGVDLLRFNWLCFGKR